MHLSKSGDLSMQMVKELAISGATMIANTFAFSAENFNRFLKKSSIETPYSTIGGSEFHVQRERFSFSIIWT